MDVYTTMLDNTLIVELSGEIDHHIVGQIKDKIDREYTTTNVRDIVFDFSQISFMDSSGIGLIMGRYKNLLPGGKLSIAGVNDNIKRVFDISGISKFVNLIDNVGGSYVR